MSELLKTYTEAQKNEEVDRAQSEAIRAKKLGEALVSQVVNMANSGTQAAEAKGFTHFMQKNGLNEIAYDSTTLALNAELKKKDAGIEATVYAEKELIDPAATTSYIEVNKIDGQQVLPDAS